MKNPTDEALVLRWLSYKSSLSARTLEAYARAAHRLLLWCAEHQLTLMQLGESEMKAYLTHLQTPPAHWLANRRVLPAKRLPTQVLYQRMSAVSLNQERLYLMGMLNDLVDLGWLSRNPLRIIEAPKTPWQNPADKALSETAWAALKAWAATLPETPEDQRHAWIVRFFYYTGIRREEASRGVMSDFLSVDGTWFLQVIGKGSKARRITVCSALRQALEQYRVFRGLPALPSPAETDVPIIPPLRSPMRLLSLRQFNGIVDKIAAAAAVTVENPYVAKELADLTPHRFRHTNAAHRLARGAALETAQDELGHEDPRTTRIYSPSSKKARIRDAELLS